MSISRLKLAVLSAVAAIGVTASHQANAAIVYSYVTDQTNYDVAQNTPVVVKLYLKETLSGGSTSLITSDGGMFAVGAEVQHASSAVAAPSKITGQATNTSDFGGPTSNSIDASTDTAFFAIAIGTPPAPNVQLGNTGGGASPNTLANEIYIGTVTITAGGPGVNNYSIIANSPAGGPGGNTLTKTGYDLDLGQDPNTDPVPGVVGAANSITPFTVTVTPEPASLGLLACGGLLALRRRRA
ncbi:MAG: hypothetical protein JWM97_3314 [Phycisphaerales bacterium]|jgi:hypothetical protein|nr:hypothetical protein [Phycisphaerales bacterium]MDB5305765.1 hypothetical protein [Phycisphaerales bacterium]